MGSEWLAQLTLISIIDYLIIALSIGLIYNAIKGTRVTKVFYGFLILYLLKNLAFHFHLKNVSRSLEFVFDNIFVLILIIFQEEIRSAINKIMVKISFFEKEEGEKFEKEIVSSLISLSNQKVGALIILEGETSLDDFSTGGTVISGEVTKELILTIFEHYSPLHDGAVVIQNKKIHTAGVVLPLSKNSLNNFRLGTRHRAGVGISEKTDCLSLIVSEETGKIRMSRAGQLYEVSKDNVAEELARFYVSRNDKSNKVVLNKILNISRNYYLKYKDFFKKDNK